MPDNARDLTHAQRIGLEKLGDIYAPGDDDFPSFSQLGCAVHARELLEFIPPRELRALQQLLSACRWAPNWSLGLLVRLAEVSPRMPGSLGSTLRALRLGLRSMVYSLYYSGQAGPDYDGPLPLQIIDYEVSVYTGDLEADDG